MKIRARAALELSSLDSQEFRPFVKEANPNFIWYKHCDVIGSVLEKIIAGTLRNVMFFIAPRHSKSEMICRLFAPYYLHKFPAREIGIGSHTAELAWNLSMDARDNYVRIGGRLHEDASAKKEWRNKSGGGLWAAGVRGPITGKGFHCLPAGSRIATERGAISVKDLCRPFNPPRVLSFNHSSNSLEWRRINARAVQPGKPLVEITLSCGRRISCTAEHLVYCVERGYTQARDLVPGQTIIQIPEVLELREMRRADDTAHPVPKMLCDGQNRPVPDPLRTMRKEVCAFLGRGAEIARSSVQGSILFRRMQPGSSCGQESSALQDVRRADRNKDQQILHEMPASTSAYATGDNVRKLREDAASVIVPDEVLLEEMQGCSPFQEHARPRQRELQGRDELQCLVQRNASGHPRTRQEPLCRMQQGEWEKPNAAEADTRRRTGEIRPRCSPRRREPFKQPARESDCSMLGLSQIPSQKDRRWITDTVSSVVFTGEIPDSVYDIQVEGNSNFFADGVLVHNCGIIDDPIKNEQEAFSQMFREGINEWYDHVWYPRREPNASEIIVMARWHEMDLAGYLLEKEKESPRRWHIVCLQALKEDWDAKFPDTCTVEPDWRQPGEALCPERFDRDTLLFTKQTIGRAWIPLYQGSPQAETGEVWDRAKFKKFTPTDEIMKVIRDVGYDWDPAYTKDEQNSASAFTKSGRDAEGNIYILDCGFEWFEFDEQVKWMDRLGGPDYVEQKASGKSIVQVLRKYGRFAKEVPVRGGLDKIARTKLATPPVDMGRVYVSVACFDRLLDDPRQGLVHFPKGEHSDLNDSFVQAINRHWQPRGLARFGLSPDKSVKAKNQLDDDDDD